MTYKIGSLFDGSGGFPLAGSLCGITPAWASEVEPYPIAVTRSRFPDMKHLGDISKINGAEVDPVDIITFGSPCQDLSVAGKRAGLKHEANGDEETTRSGLFIEAVRIIKEMREPTNGRYPAYALWENVPGAFSSNGGEDFRIVLEELIKVVEPTAVMPSVPKAGWPYADSYYGDGWSLAYRVFDAQYWGVPQRRRRIHLVLDLRGERAREVLFEREGVRGHFAQGGTAWQAAAGDAENGIGADDRAGVGDVIPINTMIATRHKQLGRGTGFGVGEAGEAQFTISSAHEHAVCYVEPVGCDLYNHAITGDTAATLTNMMHKGGTMSGPTVAVPYTLKIRSGCEGGGKGALVQTDMSATLATNNDQYLFQPMSIRDENWASSDVKNAIRAGESKSSHCVVEQHLFENHSQDTRYKGPLGVCPMLPAQLGTGGNNTPFVVESERVYCLQGNGIDRADTAGCNGKGWTEDVRYTLNTIDRPAVAYSVGNGQLNQISMSETCNTLDCMHDKQSILVEHKQPVVRYIVRRLTPTECARLQGFPDKWGHPDSKDDFTEEEYRFWLEVRNTHATINGKAVKEYTKEQMVKWYNGLHTDSAEYKLWGNGIALPPALYCMQGIRDALDREMEPIVEPEDELPEEVRKAFGPVLDQILQRIKSIEKRLKEVAM